MNEQNIGASHFSMKRCLAGWWMLGAAAEFHFFLLIIQLDFPDQNSGSLQLIRLVRLQLGRSEAGAGLADPCHPDLCRDRG